MRRSRSSAAPAGSALSTADAPVRREPRPLLRAGHGVPAQPAHAAEHPRVARTRGRSPSIRSPFVPRGAAAASRHLCFDAADMEQHISPALREHPLSYVSYTPFFAAPDATHLTLAGRSSRAREPGLPGRPHFHRHQRRKATWRRACTSSTALSTAATSASSRSPASSRNPRSCARCARRGPVKGKCSRCRYGDSCRGCRALAYYHGGDYLAPRTRPASSSPRRRRREARTRTRRPATPGCSSTTCAPTGPGATSSGPEAGSA